MTDTAAHFCVDLQVGDQVRIGDAVMTVKYKSGRHMRAAFSAPAEVKIEVTRNEPPQPVSPFRRG